MGSVGAGRFALISARTAPLLVVGLVAVRHLSAAGRERGLATQIQSWSFILMYDT